jgi:ABC-type transport system substrate-binding protein
LQRGEISAIPHVAPIDLAALQEDPRFFVLPYAQPLSHLIQFHPRSLPLRNGQLRRALLHAIPRQKILDEQILPGIPAEPVLARLSASPLTMATAEYNRLLPQPEYEPILSAGLTATARKELGGSIPPLRITFPPEVEIRRAVDAMIANWKRVGIEVIPVDSLEEGWDLAYRTVRFREPFVDLWPFLANDPSAGVASLSPFPERLRRQLMDLERATSWSGAIQTLHRLQADLLIDAWWIPLWEIDEFCLFRRNVTGLPERFVNPYQNAERWVVQPWYPTENP